MSNLHFLDHLPAHQAILERALACYVPDKRVAGVMLYGSLALGQGDAFSDIDLNIVVPPEHHAALLAEAPDTLRTFGSALYIFRAIHHSPNQVVAHYTDHVKLDLDFMLPGTMGVYPERRHHHLYKDTTGELASLLAQAAALPVRYSVQPLEVIELDQRFWPWCYQVAVKAQRGELWEAHGGLAFVREWTFSRLAAWLEGVRPIGYRRIEQRVSPQWLAGWEQTAGAPELDDLLRSLAALIGIYRRMRLALAERLDLAFDPAPEAAMCRRLAELGVPLSDSRER